jgi:hypothetical protein
VESPASRIVILRDEWGGDDRRHLSAHLEDGSLVVEGHDLGPGTAVISPDGEYEWWWTIAQEHLPQLVELLGGAPGEEILDLLETRYTGDGSYRLEEALRTASFPIGFAGYA